MVELTYQTLVSDPLSLSIPPTPFGPAFTSPNTSTLILGEREAVLVDPPVAVEQAVAVADWVASFDRTLTFIVSTHGHADHWFGTERVLNRFRDARPVASAATVAMMAVQGSAEFRAQSYDAMLPGQIGDTRVVATPLEGGTLQLEGQDMHLLDMGHSDTDNTSVVHVPSIGLVVGGDVVYNGVHQYLAESVSDDALGAWLAAVDRVADPRPVTSSPGTRTVSSTTTRGVWSARRGNTCARRSVRGTSRRLRRRLQTCLSKRFRRCSTRRSCGSAHRRCIRRDEGRSNRGA